MVKAGALKYGTHLRTTSGSGTAVVTGGWARRQRNGWMWDLTVPGDHDFYIDIVDVPVLVHNCPENLQEIEDHVVPRHAPGGAEAEATKSLFDPGENLENLAEDSAGRIGLRQANGNIQYVIRLERIVGSDRSGLPINVYTIIRSGYGGDLVTMFPGAS